MEANTRTGLTPLLNDLQEKYKEYVLAKWDESIRLKLQTRLVISFNNGYVTGIQDQAIIAGSSILDLYTQRVVDLMDN